MGKPAVSLRYKLIALCAAGLLACGLLPTLALADDSQAIIASQVGASSGVASALADQVNDSTDFSSDDSQQVSVFQNANDLRVAPMLASGLFGSSAGIVNSDVTLDSADPIIGSFTADGLTYAVGPDGLTLVAVDAAASDGAIDVPASVIYNGVAYPVAAIGPYAFYLSGVTDVALPDSILSVDDRAFHSSDVGAVSVDPANPNFASFDGALYSVDKSCLLLIPEGRKGSVLLSCETEVVQASLFSHCSLVEAISVEEGGAAFSSWDGLLYDASGTTLLRVPAGATDITIRDGCTTIAAGALEGCAKLEHINAPASVISISPDVFTSVPTVSLPAASVSGSSAQVEGEAEASPRRVVASSQGLEAPDVLPDLGSTSASPSAEASGSIPQLTAMVALSSTDDDLPEADPSSIEVALPDAADSSVWEYLGFSMADSGLPSATIQEASSHASLQTGNCIAWVRDDCYVARAPSLHGTTDRWYPTDNVIIDTQGYRWRGWWQGADGSQFEYGVNPVSGEYVHWYLPSTGSHLYAWQADDYGNPVSGYLRNARPSIASYEEKYPSWDVNAGTMYDFSFYPEYVLWDDDCGPGKPQEITRQQGGKVTAPTPSSRDEGLYFAGWYDSDGNRVCGAGESIDYPGRITLYARWLPYEIDFDVDSEPGDADYPADSKDSISAPDAVGDDGTIEIEDPKRPGYVFEGWVIPNAGGTEAIDQDLVYQGDDGKWYVDASKLPDYAGDDGRVELTARWTSVISVDVPSSVTFYADLVTQGQESREGAASGAFGQSKVANQSQVDLRVVGLESSAVLTTDSTLGADSILKKADAATPSTSTQKLLSLYPSTKQWKPEDLQNPDAVGGSKATTAVDFDLDDILLEKSFKADDFTIAAGGTLNMGYRLNLTETGQQLDYDALSTLSEGQSASIANVSYTFAGEAYLGPAPSGDETDPLYVTVDEAFISANGLDGKAMAGTYGLADIKAAAEDIASKVTVAQPAAGATAEQVAAYWDTVQQQASTSNYYALYKTLLDKQVMNNGTPIDSTAPYFQLKVDGVYLPLQLIGICQDTKSDGTGKAGLTFQMRDIYAANNMRSDAAGGGAFNTYMNTTNTNSGGWSSAALRSILRSTFWGYLPKETQAAIAPVDKHQQRYGGVTAAYLQKATGETVWLSSMYEVFGASFSSYNESEALTSVSGYVPFQYMAYQGNAGSPDNTKAVNIYNGRVAAQWARSTLVGKADLFGVVGGAGGALYDSAARATTGAVPCFCL